MTFSPDTEMALRAAAALVNTLPDQPGQPDGLETAARLGAFLDEQSWFGVRRGGADELVAVRALRPRLRTWWDLEEVPLVDDVNLVLAEAGAVPQLVDHDDLGWHVHAVPQDAPLVQRMAVEAAMAFVDMVRSDGLDRLKHCEGEDCEHVVVDLSRNRSRRFCEDGCGNREHVRAYRDRQRSD